GVPRSRSFAVLRCYSLLHLTRSPSSLSGEGAMVMKPSLAAVSPSEADLVTLAPAAESHSAVANRLVETVDFQPSAESASESNTVLPHPMPADDTASKANWPQVPGFTLLKELGRGGMGVVFLAQQNRLNRLVALKMVLAGNCAGKEERLRFLAEAEASA